MTLGRSIVGGIGWTIASRWGIRAIGLINTIILARLLVPQDFGIVAMATLAASLIEVFTETGLSLYLIRQPNPERSYFDSVWSLRVITGFAFGGLIFLAAPLVSIFFNEPLVTPVMQVLAINPILGGLQNTGIIWFRKNMQFSKDFQFLVAQKAFAFLTTILLAFTIGNYWALVAGILAGSVAGLCLSYIMHDYRPRWDLSRSREVWRFSLWMLAQHVFNFLNDRVDEFIVGRFKGTHPMGLYSVAADVGAAPVREIIGPSARVLFPAFSTIANDRVAVTSTFEKVSGAVAIMAFALGPGTALIASDFVIVVLGEKWIGTVSIVQYLAISAAVAALSQAQISIMPVLGRERLSVKLLAIRLLLLTFFMTFAAIYGDVEAIAAARLLAVAATFLIIVGVCARLPEIRIHFRTVWRPLLACIAMSMAVVTVQNIGLDTPVARLVMAILSGAFVYTVAIVGLWVFAGKPPSIEADLFASLRRTALPPK